MKGIICIYSGSGNTRLACQYIVHKVKGIEFDVCDIVKEEVPDLQAYDLVGFATFTDFWGPPYLVQAFIKGLPEVKGKPAFVFNTYGMVSGKTLRALEQRVTDRGFKVVAGYSLHAPESYPPMVARGVGNEQAPNEREMEGLDRFIRDLNQVSSRHAGGKEVQRTKPRIGPVNSLLPMFPRTRARKDMGEKYVDEALCIECGLCAKGCPYGAIVLDPKPAFDMDRCYGCWACFNHCPQKAIYTAKFRGVGHYPKPIDTLREKLA